MFVSIADEGNSPPVDVLPSPADPGGPKIVSVDGVTGTVWAKNNTGPSYEWVSDQFCEFNIATSTGSVSAISKAFTITIDRNGAPAGSIWGLRVFVGVPALDGPYASNWDNGNVVVPFKTQDNASGWNGVANRGSKYHKL